MSKLVYILSLVGVVFLHMYGDSVVTSVSTDELAKRFTKVSLRMQLVYAESVKWFDINRVYVFDNVSYFKGAHVVIRNDVRVKTNGGKYAVLSEAAQEVLDSESYKEFCGETQLNQDEIGYYI